MTTLLAVLALATAAQDPAMPLGNRWAEATGLHLTTLRLPEGDVIVYLPARLSAGDKFSGKRFPESGGRLNFHSLRQ